MQDTDTQLQGTLSDRGVEWQAIGFTLTGIICLVVLNLYERSDDWPYKWFETATVGLYWSFVVPLAALFDGGRKLFEKGKAIREAKKAEMLEKERKRIQKELERRGVPMSRDVIEAVFGDSSQAGA